MPRQSGPAYRIETRRTRLCCLQPEHTERVHRAIAESLTHLAPSMPWTRHEPLTLAQRLTWLRTQRGHFDLDSDYTYGVFSKDGAECLGIGLLKLSPEPGERELGYWIHAAHVRQGLATEVGAALVRVAFELEPLSSLELHMLPENEASRGVALKLGFEGPRLVEQALSTGDGELRDLHAYTLTRLAQRALPRAELSAFDARDAQIL